MCLSQCNRHVLWTRDVFDFFSVTPPKHPSLTHWQSPSRKLRDTKGHRPQIRGHTKGHRPKVSRHTKGHTRILRGHTKNVRSHPDIYRSHPRTYWPHPTIHRSQGEHFWSPGKNYRSQIKNYRHAQHCPSHARPKNTAIKSSQTAKSTTLTLFCFPVCARHLQDASFVNDPRRSGQ